MGFFEKVFGKAEKAQEIQKASFSFQELPAFLGAETKSQLDELQKTVFSKFAEVKHELNSLNEGVLNLKNAKVSQEDGNKRLRKIVSTSQQSFVSQMNSLSRKLFPPQTEDFLLLQDYVFRANDALTKELAHFGKSIAYTGIILKEETKAIGANVGALQKIFADLKNLFEEKKALFLVEQAKSQFDAVNSLQAELASIDSMLPLTEKQIDSLKKDIAAIDSRVEKLRVSPDLKEFNDLMKEKSDLMREKQELKTKFIQLLAPVEKPFKRFLQLVDSKQFPLSAPEKELLEAYFNNPFIAFKRDPNTEKLKVFLKDLKKLIEDGKISLKEKDKAKKLSALTELQAFNFFDNVFWKLNKIESTLLSVEKRLSSLSVSSQFHAFEKESALVQKEIEEKQSSLVSMRKRKQFLSEEIPKKKEALLQLVESIVSKKVSFKD